MPRWLAGTCMRCLIVLVIFVACSPQEPPQTRTTATISVEVGHTATATLTPAAALKKAPATPTPRPTQPPTPTPSASATATSAPSPSPTATFMACNDRMPRADELLTLVTRDFGLSRDFQPEDLVPLSDYFPNSVTLGYPTEIRAAIAEPLQEIIQAMQADGLAPQIVSGYRSYSAQTLALQKWLESYPDWAHNLSAPPGHSEHQLGTTVDFGSPELKPMLGEDYVQFHPAFAQTSEGNWLAEHAPEFGFTMSYPEDAFERTSFYYEPWHFRYIGRELARTLAAQNLTLTEYLLQEQPIPCVTE